jgi:hypothetical protein
MKKLILLFLILFSVNICADVQMNGKISTVFKPILFADCIVWLDSADSSTIELNGSNVSQWNDKSGQGNNAVQSSGANQPAYTDQINDRNVITFTYLSDRMEFSPEITLAIANGAEVFVAIELESVVTDNKILCGESINSQTIRTFSDTLVAYNTTTLQSDAGVLSTNIAVLSFRFTGTAGVLAIDGTDVKSGAIAAVDYKIGNIGRLTGNVPEMHGKLGEIIIFDRQLTALERSQINNYLTSKWGIE